MKNLKMIGLLFLVSLQSIAQAYTPVNKNRILVGAFPFQNFTYDARSAALGEAGIAISPDANSALMNPAKLVFLHNTETTDSSKKVKNYGASLHYTPYYRNLIQGMNLYSLNLFQAKEKTAFGFGVKYFDAGSVAIYGDNRAFIKNFQSKEFSINGFYSVKLRHNNSLSVGLKYIYSNLSARSITQNINTKPVNAIAGDLYFYHDGSNTKKRWLNYGASLTNVGGKVSYGDYKHRTFQPTLLKLGVAQNFILGKKQNILMFTIDANKLLVPTPSIRNIQNEVIAGRNEENITGIGTIFQSWGTAPDGLRETMREITYSFGTEFQFREFLYARAGYYTQNKRKGDINYFTLGLTENTELYYTGAYVFKKVNSFANYRTPYWRPTDYGLLTPAGSPYLGYVPTFEGDLNDYNATIGVRSEKNGWKSDVSFTTGGNKQVYTVSNSVNRGLGKNSPIQFKPGGYAFSHNVGNIDLSKSLSEKVNLSMGSEFRAETFTIIAGDTASYATAPGADSFPGTSAVNAKTSTRYNFGGYVGLGFDITKDFLIDGTARVEKYSDFGNAFVWKISTRYKFADDKVTLRASISTGFRAPSMAQSNLQLAQASFVPGQGIQTKGIVNNYSPQAFLLGVPKLKAENSVNFTAGLGLNPTKNFSATLDFYSIKVDNRIILSSEIAAGSGAQAAALNKILSDNGIVAVSFFVNGMNTMTQGLDFVANYKNVVLGKGKLAFNLAGNYTIKNEKVGEALTPSLIKSAGQSIIDATQEALLLTSRPKYKAILGVDYVVGKMNFNLNNTLFGPTTFRQNGLNSNLKTVFEPKVVTDLGANFQLGKSVTLGLNINNIFNIMPKWNLVALNSAGEAVLKDAAQVFNNVNLITFNGRYSNVTYDGSHFSQLGTTFAANLNFRF